MRKETFVVALVLAAGAAVANAQQSSMGFFVTSTGSGKGADFGGNPWVQKRSCGR